MNFSHGIRLAGAATFLVAMLAAMPAFAHHSFKAQYDETETITLTGTVTKVTWTNPHVIVFLDVKDGAEKSKWELELASPNGLLSQGWRVDSLKTGSQISVSAHPARDGSRVANATKITLAAR